MRQQVAQHEVLAEVPGRGRLLDLESTLQGHFFRRLAAGRVEPSEAGMVIDWQVDGPLAASDERAAAEDDLHRGLDRVDSIRAMIKDRLRGVRDESLYLRVPAELARALGGRVDPAVPTGMRASELQLHLHTLEAAQRGVRHALRAGVFGVVEGRGLLVGWCVFSGPQEEAALVTVHLKDEGETSRDGVACHRLSWSLSTLGRRIELRFVDAPGGAVPGTATELHGYRAEGEWCIPITALAGRQVEAVAEIDGVERVSTERLSFAVAPPEPEPEPEPDTTPEPILVAPLIDLEPESDETPAESEDMVTPPPSPAPVVTDEPGCWPQVWRWLGVLLLVALLSFLLLTLLGKCEGCLSGSFTSPFPPGDLDEGGSDVGPGLDEPGAGSSPRPTPDEDELPRVEFTPFGAETPAVDVGVDSR